MPPQTPDTARTLRAPTQLPRATATFVGPTGSSRGTRTSALEFQKQKVGAQSTVLTIDKEEFELLKIELEEAQRLISQKQNELEHKKQCAFTHQRQLHNQLTTAVEKE